MHGCQIWIPEVREIMSLSRKIQDFCYNFLRFYHGKCGNCKIISFYHIRYGNCQWNVLDMLEWIS